MDFAVVQFPGTADMPTRIYTNQLAFVDRHKLGRVGMSTDNTAYYAAG